jgi:peptidoglycan/xylan/chitin deacetylase (PgdA/CDA1 family)
MCAATGTGLLSGCSLSAPTAPTASDVAANAGPDATSTPRATRTPSRRPAATYRPTPPASAQVPQGADIHHGSRSRPSVALTFHGAGDAAILRRMLQIFHSDGARVTVLGIGEWLAAQPADAKLILDGGHELGNHTWSHHTMPRLGAADTRTEIERAAAELRKLTRTEGRWFRPSGTPRSTPRIRAAAVTAGYGACLGYDVDPLDYTDPGAPSIVRNFAAAVRPGSIVSLHLGHEGTLAAMPDILAHLHRKGLAAVTVSQLLGFQ